jgi:hypothetical protein
MVWIVGLIHINTLFQKVLTLATEPRFRVSGHQLKPTSQSHKRGSIAKVMYIPEGCISPVPQYCVSIVLCFPPFNAGFHSMHAHVDSQAGTLNHSFASPLNRAF